MPSVREDSTVRAIATEFCSNGRNKVKAMQTIGYAKTSCNSGKAVRDVYNNLRVIAAIAAIDDNLAAESKFTREKQLKDLEIAKELALSLKNPAAMTSALREQNDMLGYHRENAPNSEKIAEDAKRLTEEDKRYRKEYAVKRVNEIGKERIKLA